jgi:hypothetical protein
LLILRNLRIVSTRGFLIHCSSMGPLLFVVRDQVSLELLLGVFDFCFKLIYAKKCCLRHFHVSTKFCWYSYTHIPRSLHWLLIEWADHDPIDILLSNIQTTLYLKLQGTVKPVTQTSLGPALVFTIVRFSGYIC